MMMVEPIQKPLSSGAQSLLEAIRATGEQGITRRGLSAAKGKDLNKWDIAMLARLESDGLISVEQRPSFEKANLIEYVYRATEIVE